MASFELFHVQGGGGSTMKALELMDRPLNMLVSAWAYHQQGTGLRRRRRLLREQANLLIMDSGYLGAARAGHPEWAQQQETVLAYAEELGADRVAMMDIPMVPDVLAAVGLTPGQALEMTYRNAEALMQAKTKAAKGYVSQGWNLEQRAACLETMTQMGVPQVAEWWGIGSVAMRTPRTGLYEHAHWCRQHLHGHLHCFGVAQPERVRELMAMGIDSCDSATASMAAAYGEALANGRRVRLGGPERWQTNVRLKALLFWINVEAIEEAVFRPEGGPKWHPPTHEQGRLPI